MEPNISTVPNLLQFFKNEHKVLTNIFDREFVKAKQSQDWNSLYSMCQDLFENNHHEKEEKFIFEILKTNVKIKSGGPLCTYYFDFHMNNPSLRRALDATKKITGQTLEPNWSQLMNEIIEKNLPLAIPGEDHEAGRIILRGIQFQLSQNSTNIPALGTGIESLFNTYFDIQKSHFEREENCFFNMCMNLISPSEWTDIHAQMNLIYKELR